MNNNKNTFDILHSEFDDCPKMPDSLSKKNIVAKLENIPREKETTISFKKLGTLAAAMILVMVCTIVATSDFGKDLAIENQKENVTAPTVLHNQVVLPLMDESLSAEAQLYQVNSREKIVEWFRDNYKENNKYNFGLFDDLLSFGSDSDILGGAAMDTAAPESATGVTSAVTNSINSSSQLKDHAETNTQTQGVAEGDIIKTDSRYIYYLGADRAGTNRKLRIIDSETMEAVFDSYIYDENGDILWVSDIYVNGDTLVAICTTINGYNVYGSYSYNYITTSTTTAMAYDMTNRSQPKIIRSYTQDGMYKSSRMVGSTLYTISQYYVRAESEEAIENVCIPKVDGVEIGCDCIFLPEKSGDSYILLTAFDTSSQNSDVRSVAVLGNGSTYYCSEDTFYVVANDYDYEAEKVEVRDTTIINSFNINSMKILFKATGKVKGSVLNQYSLDQYNGKLRIATSYFNYTTQKNESSLYVLDDKLDVIGKLENIANNEQIKSVRYMGDEAYVVTFRNTDPLFAIDFSDPTKPAIKGELKIPGYSAYLHPIGDNLLVGIGYEGDSQNADFNSVKVSLFDISDSTNLKELDKLVYHEASTSVRDNPKAMIYKADEGIIGMPVDTYENGSVGYLYYIIQVKDNKLTLKHKLTHLVGYYKGISDVRGTYIGDDFFTVSDFLVKKFDFGTGEFEAQVTFADMQELSPTTVAYESKDDYTLTSPFTTPTTQGNTNTSQGYTVDEPITENDAIVTSQTTPPYNPNNPDEVPEAWYTEPTTIEE